MKLMKNALVILAGGKGNRFGGDIPKQFRKYGENNFIEHLLSNILPINLDIILISCEKKYISKYLNNIGKKVKYTKLIFSDPGNTRQESSFKALKKLNYYKPKNVLIHDSARPLVSNKLLKTMLLCLRNNFVVAPYIKYNDRMINTNQAEIKNIKNIQTPQGFNFSHIYDAHKKFKNESFLDDASLIQKLGKKIKYIKGEKTNLKITYPEDIKFFNLLRKTTYRYGIGFDIHRFDLNSNKGLKLCGTNLPYFKLIGHSDADVCIHAICDSIFGALSMNDIGYYFSNKDSQWKNVNSKIFLNYCKKLLIKKGYKIINLDINIICEKPNINKYRDKMKKNLSKILSISEKIISIKATTNEKIGFIGNGKGIASEALIHICNEHNY